MSSVGKDMKLFVKFINAKCCRYVTIVVNIFHVSYVFNTRFINANSSLKIICALKTNYDLCPG